MAILTNSGGAQLTTNAGKVIVRDTGSILRFSYGDTMTPTQIQDTVNFNPTLLAASITTTATTTGILIYVSSKVEVTALGYYGVETDIMVSGGGYNNTVLSGSSRGFASASGYLYGASSEEITYNGGWNFGASYSDTDASFNFLHNHQQSSGTTLTYTVCCRGVGRWNSGRYTPNDGQNAKSTIILMEVSQ